MLIHAAAGGVGISATQIAQHVGAEVFGTASASKHDAIRAQGVDHAIDYRTHDFEDEVRRITGRRGRRRDHRRARARPSFRKDYRLLRQGGRLVMYGFAEAQTGQSRNIPALRREAWSRCRWRRCRGGRACSVMNENKGVFGLNMLSWWDREGSLDRVTEPLLADLEAGRLKPVVAEAFPFDRAGDAHRFIAERRNIGKVVLFPS